MRIPVTRALAIVALLSPMAPAADLGHGKLLFESQCALCHGQDGTGGRGPSLALKRLKHAADDKALLAVVQNGIRDTEMPGAWQLNARELENVTAYVRSLGTVPAAALPGTRRGARRSIGNKPAEA